MENTIKIDKIPYGLSLPHRQTQSVSWEEGLKDVKDIGRMLIPDFILDKDNMFAYENIVKWAVNDRTMLCNGYTNGTEKADPRKGLYIYGNVGTGKSAMLNIIRIFINQRGFRFLAGEEQHQLAWATWRADDICDTYMVDGSIRRWVVKSSLCIQDLGSEPQEAVYMGNRRRVLRAILEARGDLRDHLTFISSNIPPSALGDYYGDRVASRIAQMCNVYRLGGQDRRR